MKNMMKRIIFFMLQSKTNNDLKKNGSLKLIMSGSNSARMPFSLQFFLIAVIFLIFNVEIALLIPMITIMEITNLYSWMLMTFFFLLILLIGLYHEWNQGALNWAN